MKQSGLLDDASANVLGLEWLIAAIAPVSPYGERLFAELHPFANGEGGQAEARARTIAQLAARLEDDLLETVRAVLRDLPDAAGAIARASMGDVLDDPHFLELRRFCATIGRIDELLEGLYRPGISNAAIRAVGAALEIGTRKEVDFYLDDGVRSAARDCTRSSRGASKPNSTRRAAARASAPYASLGVTRLPASSLS